MPAFFVGIGRAAAGEGWHGLLKRSNGRRQTPYGPDFSAARREAIEAARELLAEAIKDGRPEVPEAFVITDEAGRELDTVPLAAVLPRPLKK